MCWGMCAVVSNTPPRSGARSSAFFSVVSRHSSAELEVTSAALLELTPEQVQRLECAAAFVLGTRGRIARFLTYLAALDVDDHVQQTDRLVLRRAWARIARRGDSDIRT